MLFCAFVGAAFAQTLPAPNKSYMITTSDRGGLAANEQATECVGTKQQFQLFPEEAQKFFAFVQFDGKVYLYNVWAEKFMQKNGSLSATLPIDDITIEYLDGDKYFFKFDDEHNINLGGSNQLVINSWNIKDAGNQFTILEVEDFDPTAALAILDNSYTITYKFVYNEKEVASQTTKVTKGANYPAVDSNLLPWGATATIPDGAPAGNETVTLNCTVDSSVLPFEAADSYNDANMKWYYLQFHADAKNHLYFKATDEVLLADKTSYDKNDKDAYSWAFVGNPFDGYTIYNRKAYAQNANLKLNAAEAGATLGTADHKFIPTSSTYGTKGFFLASPNGASTDRFNKQGGKVVYWWGADAGSTFMVVERPMGVVAELEALVEDAKTLLSTVNGNLGTIIGEYSQETANTLAAAITTAEGKGDAATAEDVAALQTAMDAVKVILPTVGQYYQFHSSLDAFAETKAAYSNGTQPEWKTLNGDDKSFYWKAVAAENGNVVFQNAADGKYLVGNAGQSGAWTMAEAPSAASNVDIKIFNKANDKGYEYGLVLNGWQMHCNNHGGGANASGNIVSWNTNAANSASSWFLVPVELQEFYDVTYNFVYGDDVKYSTTTSVAAGAGYPAVVAPTLPYGVTVDAQTPEGTVTGSKSFNFALTISKELPFKTATGVNTIDTWYYVRMHTNQPGYIGDIAEDNSINVAWGQASDEYNENYLWGFVGDVFDGITVVNKGTDKQLTSTGNGNATLTENGTAFFVAPTTETTANATYGFCLRKKDSNNYLNANYGAAKLSHWASTDAGSTMFLTEYTETEVAVSDAGFATLYLGHSTYLPEGVEAYIVTEIANGYVDMTAVEGFIPANTGVILKNEGEFVFKAAAKDGNLADNMLRGSVENTYVEGAAYVLGKDAQGAGFFKAKLNKNAEGSEGDTHFLNNANKAYLPVPVEEEEEPAQALRFNFGGTTAIESVVNGINANAAIYDLSGRRVEKATKGIYIVNGKKMIVK